MDPVYLDPGRKRGIISGPMELEENKGRFPGELLAHFTEIIVKRHRVDFSGRIRLITRILESWGATIQL